MVHMMYVRPLASLQVVIPRLLQLDQDMQQKAAGKSGSMCVQVAASKAAGGKAWPPSLRSYVERAFGIKTSDAERALLNVSC